MADDAADVVTVLLRGRVIGTITQHAGALELTYDDDHWRTSVDATPLSLSLPVARRSHADTAARSFLGGGSDAHAKNFSLLLAGRRVRSAPLYDVASALVYPDLYPPKLRMAMRIGGEYRMARFRARHWRRLAVSVGVDPDARVARVDDLASQAPDALAEAGAGDAVRALGSDLPARLTDRVAENAEACRAALKTDAG